MRNNLKIAIPLAFVSMLFFPSVTWMFYFAEYLDYQQIAGIMGVGALVTLVMEVPTGVFADIVGRKWAISLSYLLFTIAMIVTTLSTNYVAFLVVTVVNALVNSLYSGSMEALVYDTLKSEGAEAEFDVWISRMESVTWVGLFVSAVVGGYMYTINHNLPYYAQAVFTAIATFLSLYLVEPRLDSTKYQLKDMWKNNLVGFNELFSSPKTRYLTGIFVILGLGYYIAADLLGLSQLREYGLNTKAVGWVFGVGYLISASLSHFYPIMRKAIGEMKLMLFSSMVMITSFVFAKYVGLFSGLGLVTLRIASSTTFHNSKSVIINKELSSKNRATSLSTLNLLMMFPYGLTAVFIGRYIDSTSPNQFAYVLGLLIIVMVLMLWITRLTRRDATTYTPK